MKPLVFMSYVTIYADINMNSFLEMPRKSISFLV